MESNMRRQLSGAITTQNDILKQHLVLAQVADKERRIISQFDNKFYGFEQHYIGRSLTMNSSF